MPLQRAILLAGVNNNSIAGDMKMRLNARFSSSGDGNDGNDNGNNDNEKKDNSSGFSLRRPSSINLPPPKFGAAGGGSKDGGKVGGGGGGKSDDGWGDGWDDDDWYDDPQPKTSQLRRPPDIDLPEPNQFAGSGLSWSDIDGEDGTTMEVEEGQDWASQLRPHEISLFPGNYGEGDDEDDEDHHGNEYDSDDDADMEEEDYLEKEERTAEDVQKLEYEEQKKRKRWLENSKSPIRVPKIDQRTGRAYGKGGRKSASARVWIQPGFGYVVVNRQNFVHYFDRESDREHILEPLLATNTCGKFDLLCYVTGGGLRGKAGAIRNGLANALVAYNPTLYRPPLKELGMMTRDDRRVEPKKPGRRKARKLRQWQRR